VAGNAHRRDPGPGGSRGPNPRPVPARPHTRGDPVGSGGVRPGHEPLGLRVPSAGRGLSVDGSAPGGPGLLGHARPPGVQRRGGEPGLVRRGRRSVIVVTGGAGFIGSAVVRRLLQLGHEVRVVDDLSKGRTANVPEGCEVIEGDVSDPEVTARALKDAEACFHLAAKIGGIGYFHKFPADILDDNNLMLSAIFRTALETGTKIVYVSSSM